MRRFAMMIAMAAVFAAFVPHQTRADNMRLAAEGAAVTPRPSTPPEPERKLEVPKTIGELQGCWRSSEGDVLFNNYDGTPGPTLRLCFCLGGDGNGTVRMRYSDNGLICSAPLSAKIAADSVFLHYDEIVCPQKSRSGLVAADITCRNGLSQETTCEKRVLGPKPFTLSQQFVNTSEDYCSGGKL